MVVPLSPRPRQYKNSVYLLFVLQDNAFFKKEMELENEKSSNKATKSVSELCLHYKTSMAYFRRVKKQLRGDI